MTHYYETKIGKIITEEVDTRMDGAIISEILRLGWEKCAAITDEEIENVQGNGIMTKEFIQAMLRAERRICKECGMYKDFFPYIRKYMNINDCKVNDLTLDKKDFESGAWFEIADKLDLKSNADYVDIIAIVDEN